jgi:hypothetical protein
LAHSAEKAPHPNLLPRRGGEGTGRARPCWKRAPWAPVPRRLAEKGQDSVKEAGPD